MIENSFSLKYIQYWAISLQIGQKLNSIYSVISTKTETECAIDLKNHEM
jgi:hypothetical protein